MIGKTQCVERSGVYPFQRIQDELFIVDPKAREMHQLNEVGARIWDLLAQPRQLQELIDTIADEYEVNHSAAEDDVVAFMEEMMEKKLVKVVEIS